MRKTCIKILLLLLIPLWVNAQQRLPDSTATALKTAPNDSSRYAANMKAYYYFEETNRNKALYYTDQMLLLAKRNNKPLLIARALANKGYQLSVTGQYAEALKNLLQAFAIAGDPKNASNSWFTNHLSTPEKTRLLMLSLLHHMFAILMGKTENTGQMIFHFKEAKRIALEINNPVRIMLADMDLGEAYIRLNKIDSALIFEAGGQKILT